jgi:RNA polymerase-interacting CarD/CdnL/TRCF family regulator
VSEILTKQVKSVSKSRETTWSDESENESNVKDTGKKSVSPMRAIQSASPKSDRMSHSQLNIGAPQELQWPTSRSSQPQAENKLITQAAPISSRSVSILENIDDISTDVIHPTDTATSNRASQDIQRPNSWSSQPQAKNKLITQAVPISSRNVSIVENIDEESTDVIHPTDATTSNRASQDIQRPNSWSSQSQAENKVITQAAPISSRSVSIVKNIDEESTDVIHPTDATTSNRASQDIQRPPSWSSQPQAENKLITQAVPISSRNVSIVENIDVQITDLIDPTDATTSNRASQELQRPTSRSSQPQAENKVITQAAPIFSRSVSILENIDEQPTDVICPTNPTTSNRASQELQRPTSLSSQLQAENKLITQAAPISSRSVSILENIDEQSTDLIHPTDNTTSNRASQDIQRPTSRSSQPQAENKVITQAAPIFSRSVSILENIDEQPTDLIHPTDTTTSNRASQDIQRPTSWSPLPEAANRVITQAVPISSRNVSIVENIDEQTTDLIDPTDATTSNRASQELQRPTSWSPLPEVGNRVITQAVPISSRTVSIVENIEEQPTDVIHPTDGITFNRASQDIQRPTSWSPLPEAANRVITQAAPISSGNVSIVKNIDEISTNVIHPTDATTSNRASQDLQRLTSWSQDVQQPTSRPQDLQRLTSWSQDVERPTSWSQDVQRPTSRPQDVQRTTRWSQDVQRPTSWSPEPEWKNEVLSQTLPISLQNVSMVETIGEISNDVIHSADASASNAVIDETLNNRLNSVSYMNEPLLCVTTCREFLPFKYETNYQR